jgi:hypothetical protein
LADLPKKIAVFRIKFDVNQSYLLHFSLYLAVECVWEIYPNEDLNIFLIFSLALFLIHCNEGHDRGKTHSQCWLRAGEWNFSQP